MGEVAVQDIVQDIDSIGRGFLTFGIDFLHLGNGDADLRQVKENPNATASETQEVGPQDELRSEGGAYVHGDTRRRGNEWKRIDFSSRTMKYIIRMASQTALHKGDTYNPTEVDSFRVPKLIVISASFGI